MESVELTLKKNEFVGDRSKSYKMALERYSKVWEEDMEAMKNHLAPRKGENILEIGAGSGFFSFEIARSIGSRGKLWVTDPSKEQLQPVVDKKLGNMEVLYYAAENIELEQENILEKHFVLNVSLILFYTKQLKQSQSTK